MRVRGLWVAGVVQGCLPACKLRRSMKLRRSGVVPTPLAACPPCRLAADVLALQLSQSKVRRRQAAAVTPLALAWCTAARCLQAASYLRCLPACSALQEAARKVVTLKEVEPLIEAKYR